jgi:metal-responsive CopG/Arc/MetJ family transcriptional regulator
MKPIEITLDEQLLDDLDRVIGELRITRAAFIREALEHAVRRHEIRQMEEQHIQGYIRHPEQPGESGVWIAEQAWDEV